MRPVDVAAGERACAMCGKPLLDRQRRWCSRECFTNQSVFRSQAWSRADTRDHESPLEWDGRTRVQYGVLRPYQVVCLQAGHVMRRVRLTEFQAARIVMLGFKTRCGDCGGWLMLESDEDGQIGGGIQAHTVTGGYWWPESAA